MSRTLPADFEAVITEEDIERCKRQIGVPRYSRSLPFNTVASFDAIRRFAFSCGDDNPLWHDNAYGMNSRWGSQIAPPTFYVSTGLNLTPKPDAATKALFKGLFKGINKYYTGVSWTWWRPLKTNSVVYEDYSTADVIVREKSSFSGGLTVTEVYRRLYYEDGGVPLAMSEESYLNASRGGSAKAGKHKDLRRQTYTPEDIAGIDAVYAAEERRGAAKRIWEDVQVGDQLTPIAKGPLSMVDIIGYHMGHGLSTYGIGPLRYNWDLRRRMPAFFSEDRYGAPDVVQRVHWDMDRATDLQLPAPYDYGQMRADWLAHLVTNWMGDDAWLWKLSLETRAFNFQGDTTICTGEVVDKRVENGMHVVELTLSGTNQRGEITAPGSAVVSLPTRAQAAVMPQPPAELTRRASAAREGAAAASD